MKFLLKSTLAALMAIVFFASAAKADSFSIGGQTYTSAAPTETVTASFLLANAGATVNPYSGMVQMVVSGTGQSLGACENDAFYVFTCGIFADGSFYQLATDNTDLVGLNPSQDAKNFIVYDVDSGFEVSSPYVPAYRADHTYSFILDLSLLGPPSPSVLHFGVSDGVFSDNSGSYSIQITQLVSSVPEPQSLLLLGPGILGLISVLRRRK